MAIVRLVVDLEDIRARLSRPFEQCKAAVQGHRDTGRELMRWRHIHQFDLARGQPPDIDAVWSTGTGINFAP
jgi:hypothetical protein